MPTILRIGSYRFFFYAGDRDEPQHIHAEPRVRGQVLFFAIFSYFFEGNYEAVYRGGYKLREVGEFLGFTTQG